MNIGNQIKYVAADAQRQVIPGTHGGRSGRVTEYVVTDDARQRLRSKKPTRTAWTALIVTTAPLTYMCRRTNRWIGRLPADHIDATLPFVKQQGVAALTAYYKTTDDAGNCRLAKIQGFYEEKYPRFGANSRQRQHGAGSSAHLQHHLFPEMKVNWKTHPNNIGHLYSPGCFRCHDGNT